MTDTRFSSAIHMLILIAGAVPPMTSEQIARSVGTNASYIRKLALLLKKQGVIESRQGVAGFRLLVPPEELSLLRVYQAIYETERVQVFCLHQNPSDRCVVGGFASRFAFDLRFRGCQPFGSAYSHGKNRKTP